MFNLTLTLYDSFTVITWLYNTLTLTAVHQHHQRKIILFALLPMLGTMVNYRALNDNNSNLSA